jgi:adenine-specific DNA-methyltransferase
MTDNQIKFQQLLRELFQFDSADLDFGIYRIINHKRDVIERFITQDLPGIIADELKQGALAGQAQVNANFGAAKARVLDVLGEDALDAEGNLVEKFRETKAGKEYLAAKEAAKSAKGHDTLEATVYNHLFTFFSRYYQDGDFISKRRYSKKERYAIPYNGEEVTLYWANHDQYYVKTGEYFTDYTWKAPNGVTVYFKLKAADVEQNNVKGEKRFFLPRSGEMVWDDKTHQLTIPFDYRPLTEQENITYGQRNQQEAVIEKAASEIPGHRSLKNAAPALAALTAEKRRTEDGTVITHLEHHLRQYTRRNTSDFFIHKDLAGFLNRELDFYLKNEVLNLEEMEVAGEGLGEGWFQLMRLIKKIGDSIIYFLAQIENFQKMLWEKRKFITEIFYCITVGNIPESFYPDITDCEAQWEEWKSLFHVDEEERNLFTAGKSKKEKRLAFLKTHPTLVIDTRRYSSDFADRLMAGFGDLDEMTDGLLVNSENWQALNLLIDQYQKSVDCIHIDPPYNTQTSGFLYKNDYQHSSWLAMMQSRIALGLKMMSKDGAFLCHIDENEYELLHLLFSHIGISDGGTIVWDKKNPMLGRKGIATQHEYILWRTQVDSPVYLRPTSIHMILEKAQSLIREHGGVNNLVRREFASWIRSVEELTGGEQAYCLINDDGRVYQSVAMGAPEPRTDPKFHIPLIHPIKKKQCPVPPNGWSRAPETIQELIRKNEILFGEDETIQPRRKVFLTEDSKRQVSSVIRDSGRGKNDIEKFGLEFPYCHPLSLYETLVGAAALDSQAVVLDYFAGSGTNGHAVIQLNREDGEGRKFILVEMADYFDTVLLPRIKKVIFAPDWSHGKPERTATEEEADRSPRIVKVIRLESYEDTLNSIAFEENTGQQIMQFNDYIIQYMLKWEVRKSETLLNVEKLSKPFSYQLHFYRDGETRTQSVDLPETFNSLLGLTVETRKVYDDKGRRYLVYQGTTRDGRNIAVIWRETEGWKEGDYQRDKEFVAAQKLTEGADEIYVNGDSFISGAQALDPIFKSRMFAPVEA